MFGILLLGTSYGVGLISVSYGALYGGARWVAFGIFWMLFAVLLLASA